MTTFALSIILGVWLFSQGKTDLAIERALTLLIVTCPCALALATPLTLTLTLSKASKKGLIIKNDLVIEKLNSVKNIFLDKTGTITFGNLKVINFNTLHSTQVPLGTVITSLEQRSKHPVAKALKEFAQQNYNVESIEVLELNEILGSGVEGYINGVFYQINGNQIFENKKLVASFELKDQIRPDSSRSIALLKRLGITSRIVSGDKEEIVNEVAGEVGIKPEFAHGEVSPEDKLGIIEHSDYSIMIGDGANDAMALSKAFVGVAVHGSMDISLRAADVYLTTPGISPIVDLMIIAKETMKVIYRNLTISLLYNLFTVIAAFMGLISPLAAAIIMPVSSLTVLASTLIGTKELNKRLRV
jgi:Cu2+-exporting ATPase/Cu+-exporting ATPase